MTLELHPPDGLVVVSYGGGVNSVALLVALRQAGVVPRAITMADPGSERRRTIWYRDTVLPPVLERWGFPPITVVDRVTEGQHRKRAWRLETLEQECLRTKTLPSVAYGWKKCSAKYKAEPQWWWLERQPWARAEWDADRRLVRCIGYDADEEQRVRPQMMNSSERARFVPWYPLVDAGITREGCERLIADAGLPSPGKSACTYCPNNTLDEWKQLRRDEPEAFARAVAMSRLAEPGLTAPDVVGLMRCAPHGRRQLHVWAEDAYPRQLDLFEERDNPMPCECAL